MQEAAFFTFKIFHFSVLPGENIDASHLSHPLLSRGLEGAGPHLQGPHRFILYSLFLSLASMMNQINSNILI